MASLSPNWSWNFASRWISQRSRGIGTNIHLATRVGRSAPGGSHPPGGTVPTDFDLVTDNKSLTWLQTCPQLTPLYARWLDRLQEFSFSVSHVEGARNPADPLSRMAFPFVHRLPGTGV